MAQSGISLRGVGLGLMVLGLAVIGWGAFSGFRAWRFEQAAVRAPGAIVQTRQVAEGGRSWDHSTVVTFAFTDRQGTARRIETNVADNLAGYRVGTPIEVLYPPQNPAAAEIASNWRRFGPGCSAVGIGLLTGLLGAWLAGWIGGKKARVELL
ncbi:MAG: DUF3592 domain-containing protein [Planctomycetota bacterium]